MLIRDALGDDTKAVSPRPSVNIVFFTGAADIKFLRFWSIIIIIFFVGGGGGGGGGVRARKPFRQFL